MSYPTAREEQAAYWYLKLQEPQVSAEDIQAALAWQSDPENAAAFKRVEVFWRAWPGAAASPAQSEAPRPARRNMLWQAAAAALAIISVGVWTFVTQQETPQAVVTQEFATAVGQTRTVWLDDGTEVILGGATSIRATFRDDVRRIVMSDGEALFHVAKDAQRPFIVDVPNGSAQALGTTFNVHRGPDEATITVLEGIVQVNPPQWRAGAGARLHAGAQVAVSTDGVVGGVREVDAQEVANWRTGKMIFVDLTLRSIIADLNRYSSRPVTLAATDLADTRVTGNVKLNQIEAWLRGLGPVLDLELVQNEHGMVLVSRAPPPRATPP